MSLNILLQQLLNGISLGGVYALMAVGFGLIFNVLKFSNFSHGGVVTICAYIGFFLSKSLLPNFVATLFPIHQADNGCYFVTGFFSCMDCFQSRTTGCAYIVNDDHRSSGFSGVSFN